MVSTLTPAEQARVCTGVCICVHTQMYIHTMPPKRNHHACTCNVQRVSIALPLHGIANVNAEIFVTCMEFPLVMFNFLLYLGPIRNLLSTLSLFVSHDPRDPTMNAMHQSSHLSFHCSIANLQSVGISLDSLS